MNLKTLSEPQRRALLDLLVLGMYADAHLAAAEDSDVRQLLGEMGFDTDSDRDREIDAAVSRIRRHTSSVEAARERATELALAFPAKDQRRQVHELLDELLASDNTVTESEKSFAAVVGEALRV